jgi:hypothetical protein
VASTVTNILLFAAVMVGIHNCRVQENSYRGVPWRPAAPPIQEFTIVRSTVICWTKNEITHRTTVTTTCGEMTPAQCSTQHLADLDAMMTAITDSGGTVVTCS